MDQKSVSRRAFLKATSGIFAAASVSPVWAKQAMTKEQERSLSLINLHTGEQIKSVYWADGNYLEDELYNFSHLLRDHRSDSSIAMDPSLLDLLHDVKSVIGYDRPLHIISAYRSPKTNAMLRNKSKGVAKKSLHMQGKAVDIRIPGVSLDKIHSTALSMRAGGVGYYRRSNFIHLDVGRVRNWRG